MCPGGEELASYPVRAPARRGGVTAHLSRGRHHPDAQQFGFGVAAGVSFCDQYYKGFKCTASLILSNLKKENLKQFLVAEVGGGAVAGCTELFDAKYSGPGK